MPSVRSRKLSYLRSVIIGTVNGTRIWKLRSLLFQRSSLLFRKKCFVERLVIRAELGCANWFPRTRTHFINYGKVSKWK